MDLKTVHCFDIGYIEGVKRDAPKEVHHMKKVLLEYQFRFSGLRRSFRERNILRI